jgi:hypothetical protein
VKDKITAQPTKNDDLSIENFYIDISQGWEKRAAELQKRRWQIIRKKLEKKQALRREKPYFRAHVRTY